MPKRAPAARAAPSGMTRPSARPPMGSGGGMRTQNGGGGALNAGLQAQIEDLNTQVRFTRITLFYNFDDTPLLDFVFTSKPYFLCQMTPVLSSFKLTNTQHYLV